MKTSINMRAGGYTPVALIGKRILRRESKKLRSCAAHIRAGGGAEQIPEQIHDARVAARRLQSALTTLEAAALIEPGATQRLRRRLRQIIRALGAARDLDIALIV